jgi:hypothetical protein
MYDLGITVDVIETVKGIYKEVTTVGGTVK